MNTAFFTHVQEAAAALYSGLPLEKILITVRHPRTGEIAQISQDRQSQGLDLHAGYAMVAEPVRLDGVQVGQIELHAAAGRIRAARLMEVAQSLHDEISMALAA